MQERNGIVRKYRVYVKNSDQIFEHTTTVDTAATSLIVSNLVHNTSYCVQLMAHTVADGPLSACVEVITMEKGKILVDFSSQNSGEDVNYSLTTQGKACLIL